MLMFIKHIPEGIDKHIFFSKLLDYPCILFYKLSGLSIRSQRLLMTRLKCSDGNVDLYHLSAVNILSTLVNAIQIFSRATAWENQQTA